MRKILLSALLLSAAAVLSAAEVSGVVNARRLNLRLQSSLKSPVVGKSQQNEQLVITGKKGSWLEVKAPASVKVYVSRAYISNGKAIVDLTMRSDMSATAASYGKLPKGSTVKIIQEHRYGWVRIAPPENLRVYAAATYVTFDAEAVRKLPVIQPPAPKAAPAPVVTPVVKKEVKPAAKPEVKPADKPVVKKEVKPVAKPEVKPADKPVAKKEVKPVAKPVVKKEVKPVAKPVAVPKPISEKDPRVKALKEFGIDALKIQAQTVTLKGTVYKVPDSKNIATNYALGNNEGKIIGFICAQEDGMLRPFVDKPAVISGRKFTVKGWKSPIIWLDEIDKTK